VEEKGLEQRIQIITITSLSLGYKSPTVKDITWSQSNKSPIVKDNTLGPNLDMALDYYFSYTDGDAKMSLKTKISVLSTEVPISLNVVLKSLKGKMKMIFLPFPMAKIGFTFIEKPDIIIDIDIGVGGRVNFSMDQLHSTLKKKLTEVLKEKFVLPNIKYVRMPGVPKTDPLGKEVITKVNISMEGDDTDHNKLISEDETISSEEVLVQSVKDGPEKSRSIKKYLHRKKTRPQEDQSSEDTGKSEEENLPQLKEKKEKRSLFKKSKQVNPISPSLNNSNPN